MLPVLFEGDVKAVIELASFLPFSQIHQTFLDQLTETIGVVLNMIQANMRTKELLEQSGYKILELRGIPAPFPKAIGYNLLSRLLVRLNCLLVALSRGLFSYQIFVRAQAMPTVDNLLCETISGSAQLTAEVLQTAA